MSRRSASSKKTSYFEGSEEEDDDNPKASINSDSDSDQPLSKRAKNRRPIKNIDSSSETRNRRNKKTVNYNDEQISDNSEDSEPLSKRKTSRRVTEVKRQNRIDTDESRDSSPVTKRSRRTVKKVVSSDEDEDMENEEAEDDVDSENNLVDLSESDYESPPNKKKKSNYSNRGKPKKKEKKKKKKVQKYDSDSDDVVSEKRIRGAKKRKRKYSEDGKSGSDEDVVFQTKSGYGRATTGRVRTKVNEDRNSGAEFDSDNDNEDDMIPVREVEEIDIEGIDKVLDHREGKVGATGTQTELFTVKEHGDPNELFETQETETQYLIKWKDKSHLYNTWETEETLDAKKIGDLKVKGYIKLTKYQVRVSDYNSWKKKAHPDDVEFQEVEIELGRQLFRTYQEAERIFCRRKSEDGNITEYFVKWKNLPYSESTWEPEDIVKKYFLPEYEYFKSIKKAKCDPRDYKTAMKGIRKRFQPMKEQPDFIGDDDHRLRDYQLDGISFLINAWCKDNSVILADEMGLGKTIQTICFLKYLFSIYEFKGPMLVCVPLSTINAWQKAFADWAPDMNAVTYLGDQKSREIIREYECENESGDLCFNALITSYEMVWKDKTFFQDIVWSNIVVDEAHRLKNEESLLYKVLTQIDSHHRLLLTGTPLQNNLKELWCLLNYLQLDNIGRVNTGYLGMGRLTM